MQHLKYLESELKMPLMSLPVRSVVVELAKSAVLISPGSKLSDSDYQSIGRVTDIVGTNLLHTAGIPKALSHFPNAKVWLPEDHETKLKTKLEGIDITKQDWPYQSELPMIRIKGMPKINEVVFVDKKSGSLIVTDLGFNLTQVSGIGSWIILNLFGSYKKFAVSKFYLRGVQDKKMFHDSLEQIFTYDFDRIVVSHGVNIERNGKNILKEALAERGYSISAKV